MTRGAKSRSASAAARVNRLCAAPTPMSRMPPLMPLYVAWFFYLARFYLMPYLLGYSVMGMLSFPLEGEVAAGIYAIFNR